MNGGVNEIDLLAWVEGDLPDDRREIVRAALDADPALRALTEGMALDRASLRALGAERLTAPAGIIADAFAAAERQTILAGASAMDMESQDAPVRVIRFASWRGLAAAAAVAIVAGGALYALRPSNPIVPGQGGVASSQGERHTPTADRHGAGVAPSLASNHTAEDHATQAEGIAEEAGVAVASAGAAASEHAVSMGVFENDAAAASEPRAEHETAEGEARYAHELILAAHGRLEIRVVSSEPEGVVQALTDFAAYSGRTISVLGRDETTGAVRVWVEFPPDDGDMHSLLSAISAVAGERSFFFQTAPATHGTLISARPTRAIATVLIEPGPGSDPTAGERR